jgi:hypothetical protein
MSKEGMGVTRYAQGMRKAMKLNVRMHGLGQRYRAEVPRKDRSLKLWLAFLRHNAPDLCGGRRP